MTLTYQYDKYRGKCKEYCDAAVAADSTLTLVRGHYWCPVWVLLSSTGGLLVKTVLSLILLLSSSLHSVMVSILHLMEP